ncbi:MAG TPA: DUF5666 domain-containing protein [Patescibacteria group bacterium]|nr:DUF5666 domain-containing protein [Patescibacteria group bacterium]
MNKTIIICAILVILAGAGGFLGGMQYAKNNNATGVGQYARRFGTGFRQNGVAPVRGQVISLDPTTMTVKLADGSSKIIVVSTNTTYLKLQAGALSDIKSGDTVMVLGTNNSDGSVTAQNVEINPPTRGPRPTTAQ